jgi:prefoldin subunit 5
VSLIEIQMEIDKYKGYIRACNAAIDSLNQAINRIDDGTPNLKNAKDNFENGYKGGASTLALDEFNTLNTDATSQRNSVSASITSLQSIIVEFEQKIQQLEAQKAAEIQRLMEAAKELVRKAGEAIHEAADAAREAVTNVLS